MEHTFPVAVVDEKNKAIVGATVSITKKKDLPGEHFPYPSITATHADKGAGSYVEPAKITPEADIWILVVRLKGKCTVGQPFKLKAKGGEFTATPSPSAVATVTITNLVRTVAGVKQKEISFHVVLHPAAELVFIGGIDYEKKDPAKNAWLFHLYGFNRAEILRRERKLHAGTIVTVFSTAEIIRYTRVWGGKKWVDIEVAELGLKSLRTITSDRYTPEVGLDISIVDFYKHLSDIGVREPKSVKEVGIFSHSWPGGPILYNTGESAANKPNSAPRDPADFDARPKDFNAANKVDYPKLADALDPKCRWTIWGCSATTHFKFRSRAALKAIKAGKPEDEFFSVFTENESHGVTASTIEENTSEIRHRFIMDSLYRSGSYAAEAAKFLKIEVRAGCPGTGSDPVKVDGIEMLMVDLNVYKDLYAYFKAKFSPEFKETNSKWDKGYVDYHALQSRPAVPRPPFATQFYSLTRQLVVTPWAPALESVLTFWHNSKRLVHSTTDVTVVVRAVTGLVDAAKKGHLIILKDKDDAKSQAVFVQEDQRFVKITRNAKKEWVVIGADLP